MSLLKNKAVKKEEESQMYIVSQKIVFSFSVSKDVLPKMSIKISIFLKFRADV